MADGASVPAGTRYAAATASLRATTRWVLTALAATGGVLVAGVQLSQLGGISWIDEPIRFTIAAVLIVLCLGGVGYVIGLVSRVFTDEWVTLTQLGNEGIDAGLQAHISRRELDEQAARRRLEEKVNDASPELFAHIAPDVSSLHRQLTLINAQSATILARGGVLSEDDQATLLRVQQVQAAAAAAIDCANYHRTVARVRGLRPQVTAAAMVVALSLATFTVVAADHTDSEMSSQERASMSSAGVEIEK